MYIITVIHSHQYPPVPEVVVDFERQFYSVVEGLYIQLCVVIISGDVLFQDIVLNVEVSAKQCK